VDASEASGLEGPPTGFLATDLSEPDSIIRKRKLLVADKLNPKSVRKRRKGRNKMGRTTSFSVLR
jgi:hypothetical protein